jgi:hypothetical protein
VLKGIDLFDAGQKVSFFSNVETEQVPSAPLVFYMRRAPTTCTCGAHQELAISMAVLRHAPESFRNGDSELSRLSQPKP